MRTWLRVLMIAVVMCLGVVQASAQSWTTPRTWSDGELVTASIMNTHVRDNETYLKSAPTFDSDVIVHGTTTGNKILQVGNAPSTNASAFIKLLPSNTQVNWQIGANGVTSGAFELTPSTAGGGTTFTTPVVTVSSTGLATFSGIGRHIIGGGGVAASSLLRIDGGNASGLGSYVSFAKAGTDKAHVGLTSGILASGTSDDLALFSAAGVGIYSLSALRWGVNSAGDFTGGPSSNIIDSIGTPTLGGGFGTSPSITGIDSAFVVTFGTGSPSSSVTVTFGHAFATFPVCVVSGGFSQTVAVNINSTTTSTVTLSTSNGSNFPASGLLFVLCHGRP